jgi:hypothetical protein
VTRTSFQQLAERSRDLGIGEPVESFSGTTGKRTWRTSSGHWVYLFDSADKRSRAVAFARTLLECSARTAPLVAFDDVAEAAWSENVPGVPWASPAHDGVCEEFVATLQRLQRNSCGEDRRHPEHLQRRVQALDAATVEHCRSSLPWSLDDAIRAVHHAQSALREVSWCHRDLARRNLLVDLTQPEGRRVGWIDFEHARRDTPVMEWGRLWREFPESFPAMWQRWNLERLQSDRLPVSGETLLFAVHLEYWATVRWLCRRRAWDELHALEHELRGFDGRWGTFTDTCRTAGSLRPGP